jgi:sugar phosphate isomerase/epimerase
MRLGYNTNGLAHHAPLDALELLAELGYQSVALTLDHHCLNPFDDNLPREIDRLRAALERWQLRSVVETGARFLLDPRVKHEPTLVSGTVEGRQRRIDFLCRAIDIAVQLRSGCVSLWSGILREPLGELAALDRLVASLQPVVAHAETRGIDLGFEPEPGMFIDTMARFDELAARVPSPRFRLTLDVGHLHCQGEAPIESYIERYAARLVNVHIEDMRRGVHEHLEFGQGEMSFPSLVDALGRVGYQGGLHVELSRHSHEGPAAARRARDFLAPLVAHAVGSS